MKCTRCKDKAIYNGYGQFFCKRHFLDYFENKVIKTIKRYNLYEKNDKICSVFKKRIMTTNIALEVVKTNRNLWVNCLPTGFSMLFLPVPL